MSFGAYLKKKGLLVPVLGISLLFSVIALGELTGITINLTPSMKKGIYRKIEGEIKRGDIILFCLRDPYKKIGLDRQYIMSGPHCEGAVPLIKQVIAIPGDTIRLSDNSIIVNGENYSYKTLHYDSQGRAMKTYPRGVYSKTIGYWVIGTNSNKSWDSRYWGPVLQTEVLAILKPVLIE